MAGFYMGVIGLERFHNHFLQWMSPTLNLNDTIFSHPGAHVVVESGCASKAQKATPSNGQTFTQGNNDRLASER